jgi:hypothetical protein
MVLGHPSSTALSWIDFVSERTIKDHHHHPTDHVQQDIHPTDNQPPSARGVGM